MKQRLKDCRTLIRNVLIPAKGSAQLILFQKTIAVCLLLLFFSVICSVIIEIIHVGRINAVPHWLILCQNYLIGISCSALVVVVSALIQFKFEQNNAYSNYKSVLHSCLSLVHIELTSPSATQKERLKCINYISSLHDNYNDIAYRLFWYSPRKSREYGELTRKMIAISSAMSNYFMERKADACLNVSAESFNEVIDIAIAFFNDDFETKLFQYLKINNPEVEQDEK
ncbi:MAG: hypothetical protein IKG74_02035 [Firmicutes bacterium]|nr:hypothetical protein [Bacillota bacterium]